MKCICSLIFLLFSLHGISQKFTTSLGVQMSLPQGEYKTANPDAGLGGRFNFLYRPRKDVPVKIGLELGMQVKGSTSQYFAGYVYGFYEEFQVSASNNIFSLSFMTRLQPQKFGKIKPFVDAIAGWNVFFSTVNVEQLNYYSTYNSSYSNSSKAKWSIAYGAAAGIDIPLNKRDDLGLEIKCAYIIGSNTNYLTNPRIDSNGEVFFAEEESSTTMLIPQVGLRLNIK
ncbi:MAG: hypothetical protein H0V14_10220 [Chitinophagaceae bacterium]|nr:hypothetical protein [Chitinophagaceae bacterium]